MRFLLLPLLVLSFMIGCDCKCPRALGGEPDDNKEATCIARGRFHKLEWRPSSSFKYVDLLYCGESLRGRYDHEHNEYRPFADGMFGDVAPAPIAPRPTPPELLKKAQNFGVDRDKIGGEGYSINGIPASREEAVAAMDADVPDDASKARVTLMGPAPFRERAMATLLDWQQKKQLTGKLVLWQGAEDDAILKRRGFIARPNVLTVFVQDPTGKQLAKLEDFSPAAGLGDVEAALAKWDGKLFPNLPGPLPFPGMPHIPLEYVVIGVLSIAVVAQSFRRVRLG